MERNKILIQASLLEEYDKMFPRENIIVIDGIEHEFSERWFIASRTTLVLIHLYLDKNGNVFQVLNDDGYKKKILGMNISEVIKIVREQLYGNYIFRVFKNIEEFSHVCSVNLKNFFQEGIEETRKFQSVFGEYQTKYTNWLERREKARDYAKFIMNNSAPERPEPPVFYQHFLKAYEYKDNYDLFVKYAFQQCTNLTHFYHEKDYFSNKIKSRTR